MDNKTEKKQTFTPEDELRPASIDSGRLSPDASKIVYTVRKVDLENEKEAIHLWLYDINTDTDRQLTQGEHKNSAPHWSPDGKSIAFLSTRSDKPQVFVIPAAGGEAVQLTKMKQGVGGGPFWSPDRKHIAFTAGETEEPRDPGKPYRITRGAYRMDGIGYLDDAVQNIFVLPVSAEAGIKPDGEPRQLTEDALMDEILEWSPDGSSILYLSHFKPDSMAIFSGRLSTVNLEGVEERLLGEEWGDISTAAWLPDGEHIALYALSAGAPGGSKDDMWVLNRLTKEVVCRTRGFDFGFDSRNSRPLVLDSERALCSVTRAGMEEIYEFSLIGGPEWHVVISGQRLCPGLDTRAGKLLFLTNRIQNPAELCLANTDGSGERQLTKHNEEWLSEIDLPVVERFTFENPDGARVEGWFLRPPVGEAPYPGILCIHGGPYGMYGYGFRPDFQMLAGAGYGVLFINPHGSAGYGDEFSRILNDNWGFVDYPEQMQAVDLAIEKGWIDADRLGVNGLSYGGYMTCWIVGHTNRFKAAVAENPVTDLISQYGTSDMDVWDAPFSLGGHPHENYERYREISPITYAHRCTTPTLLIQGEADYRCPAGQSEQFYTTLKVNGCTVEMLRLPGSSHIGSIAGAVPIRTAQNQALLDWMNRYVKGENQ